MSTLPRLLVLMGSGETSPTMVKTHRELFDRLGPPPVPAVLLDTPFGFQANAGDIAARAVGYFDQSVGRPVSVASFRSAASASPVERETMLQRLREARYVFAGPGSPSYALRQWTGSLVPEVLSGKLATGGCITFASAAALTLGVATVPVYEIYKVGADPEWLEGLDLLAAAGLKAAVIPHYDNAEGTNHDTRFCYLGEARLALMERRLPEGAFVLGIDEHTACMLDLDAGTATVAGRGALTVRAAGRSDQLPSGTTVPVDRLVETADRLRRQPGHRTGSSAPPVAPGGATAVAEGHAASGGGGDGATGGAGRSHPGTGTAGSPFLEALADHEAAFAASLERRDVASAVSRILDLQADLVNWAADTLQSDELDQGRAALRSMIMRLGELAETGVADPAEAVAPYVEVLLDLRAAARKQQRWADSDKLRDCLAELGIEVRDGPEGSTWRLAKPR